MVSRHAGSPRAIFVDSRLDASVLSPPRTLRHERRGRGPVAEAGVASARTASPDDDRATRSKIAVVLAEAADDPTLFDHGRDIESALFALHGDAKSPGYRSRARVLAANLRRNPDLRRRVVDGDITPKRLCALTPDELATDELERRRAAAEERATRKRTRGAMDGAVTTDKYQCAECGGKDCAYVNVSGRRDVGKGETWGSSDAADETKVLVACRACRFGGRRPPCDARARVRGREASNGRA